MSGKLIITRHGESEWNAKGVWTGTTNVHLTTKGRHEGELMGEQIRGFRIGQAYVSEQVRTTETLQAILKTCQQPDLEFTVSPAINERDYGIYTGKNKWQVQRAIGSEAFNAMRRGWNVPIPGGETLKEVYDRSIPFYINTVVPQLLAGQNVLIVAHGNSIRSIMKYIESISDTDIEDLEMLFGEIIIYQVDSQGKMVSKQVKQIDSPPPPA